MQKNLTRIIPFLTSLSIAAADTAATPDKNNDWEVTGAAGLTLADGNAQSLSYSLQLLASRVTATDEIYLGADYFYGDDRGVETANSLRFNGQYNRLLGDRFYYGFLGSYLTDTVADIDYRLDTSALLGYYLLKSDKSSLSVEAGPGYTWEDQGGISDTYASLRLSEKFTYNLSARSKFWQNLIFTPEVGDFSNSLLVGEAGIDTLLTGQWSLRTFVRHQVDSTPALGRKEGDTSVLLGLAYSLSGFPEAAAAGRRSLKTERAPAAVAAMGWTSSAALGYSLASGNADSAVTTAMIDTAYRTPTDEFFANAAANYAQNNGATSIQNIRANLQYNHLLSSRYFAGAGMGYQKDQLADLSYRFTPAAVLGTYLVKDETSTLSVEAGPSVTLEKTGGVTDNFVSIQAAERFTYAFSSRCTLNQNLIYNAEAADTSNFIVTATAFVDTDITDSIALRIAATYIFDNTPALGRESHDTTLTSGLAVKF
jgi:putative salt-induced outer membrane protein YdiY